MRLWDWTQFRLLQEREVMRDPIAWALSIQAEYERAEAADDEFRESNILQDEEQS